MSKYVSDNTMKRLPHYLEYLQKLKLTDQLYISSKQVAEALDLGEVQVRKDLASASNRGKPRVGYLIDELIFDLELFLGYKDLTKAVVIGAGKLGRALLDYNGFEECGLTLVMGFDKDPSKLGRTDKKEIYDISDFDKLVKENDIKIAIICVPSSEAQIVADIIVRSGIKAILTFAPGRVEVPSDVIVKSENLAHSLALLSIDLKSRG